MNGFNRLTIRTPEGIGFSIDLAGPVARFGAWLVDICCVMAMARVVQMGLEVLGRDIGPALAMFTIFALQICYGMTLEHFWKGRTLGKKMFGLRVMDARGLRLQFSQVAVRNLMRPADQLPIAYMLGGLFATFSRHGQRLGDLAANTVVVREAKWADPDLSRLRPSVYNSLRERPHLEARLRQNIAPREAALALDALRRRDELAPEARVELFRALADHFRGKVDLPPEVVEGVSDENITANIVEALFRRISSGKA